MKDNLIAGFVSGLIVTAFVVVLREVWNRILIPWFEERVYKDVKIEGSWFALYPALTSKRQEAITLERHGHAVTGTIICTAGEDEGEQYRVSGSFRNLILPLIYESSDRSKTDRGTITLRLVRNAERLEGKVALCHTPSDRIDASDVIWFRTKAALDEVLTEIAKRKQQVEELQKRQKEADEAMKEFSKQLEKNAPKAQSEPPSPEAPPDEKVESPESPTIVDKPQ